MTDELEERIATLERALTGGEQDLAELTSAAEVADRVGTLEDEQADLKDRLAELEAATQALRGYVGNIRSVNRDVEERADAALAKVESLESTLTTDGGEAADDPSSAKSAGRSGQSSPVDAAADRQPSPESEPGQAVEETRQRDSSSPSPGHETNHAAEATLTLSREKGQTDHPTHQDRSESRCASCGRPRSPAGENDTTPGQQSQPTRPNTHSADEGQTRKRTKSRDADGTDSGRGDAIHTDSRVGNGTHTDIGAGEGAHTDNGATEPARNGAGAGDTNQDGTQQAFPTADQPDNGDAGTLQRIRRML